MQVLLHPLFVWYSFLMQEERDAAPPQIKPKEKHNLALSTLQEEKFSVESPPL
jgi:hypothetical protein